MVDRQEELDLDRGGPGGTPDAAASVPAAEDGAGDASDLAAPETAPEAKAPEAPPPEAAAPARLPAVDTTQEEIAAPTARPAIPDEAFRKGAAEAARVIGSNIDSVLRPLFADLNTSAARVTLAMDEVTAATETLGQSLDGTTSITSGILDNVEQAAAATAGPNGWAENLMSAQTEFALLRKDLARIRAYDSQWRRWAFRVLLTIAVLAVPVAFMAGGYVQRDHALLDIGRDAGFRRAWSEWIWRHHSAGLLDCAVEARRRGEALTCQIRMAPPE